MYVKAFEMLNWWGKNGFFGSSVPFTFRVFLPSVCTFRIGSSHFNVCVPCMCSNVAFNVLYFMNCERSKQIN